MNDRGYKLVDIDSFKRKEHFWHYIKEVPCNYCLTTNIEITNLIKKKYKLYPSLIYSITKAVNNFDEFKMRLIDDKLAVFDILYPCYTIFHKDDETFSNVWSIYEGDFEKFKRQYQEDLEKYGTIKKFISKPNEPNNTFPISMIPWTSFTGFNLNLPKNLTYLAPIFTMGKYYKDGDSYFIPLAIQVHHAVCDGFHVARFLDYLKEVIKNL